jgi:hypothetical protein
MKLRFSIRDLLWLTLVAALFAGFMRIVFRVAIHEPDKRWMFLVVGVVFILAATTSWTRDRSRQQRRWKATRPK